MTQDRPDYAHTIRTPQTELAMRAQLDQNEPKWVAFWDEMGLYQRLRDQSRGRPKFILHDGPPYANGDLHIGHAQNKILKDVINRSRQMRGYDAPYVPGWDCHGLPIEWKVEEGYRDRGQSKDDVDLVEFRRECRAFAEHWVKAQTQQFRRLGVLGDWDQPYTTMDFAAEGQIVRELGKFLLSDNLYRGSKPVLWSTVEKTALADAEVEYKDHKSVSVWVKFPLVQGGSQLMQGASLVIWTTTTWTLPANRALAFSPELDYGVYQVGELEPGALAKPGEKLVLADALAESVRNAAKIASWERLGDAALSESLVCHHPLHARGFAHAAPLLAADYVTAEQGTGIVHIAPSHGLEDYELAHLKHGIEAPLSLDDSGVFVDTMPLFAGLSVMDEKGGEGTVLGPILRALTEAGGLLAKAKVTHSYPHSWRSKAPLIYRNTAQWFIGMQDEAGEAGLRATALKAIDQTRFVPERGRNRLRSMIETRPDWCVSRQRFWGVPLPLFVEKRTGQVLRDAAVIERIAQAFEAEGGDAWFTSPPERFLGNTYDPKDYEQVQDVVEVWFDSGATHAFVLEARPELSWPADLYLEGSDQHRGWFHSSLLVGSGTRGRAPYEAVLTHGFALDEKGQKMSKSLGNGIAPSEIADTLGIDVLRLWVLASNYGEDVRIGPKILKQQADAYRRLRNTFRFLLGNLADYDPAEAVAYDKLPELERWVLHRLASLNKELEAAVQTYDFHRYYLLLFQFANTDLSAFYFDVRKDSLYCDAGASEKRRAVVTVLAKVFEALTAWLAPVLVFTTEEVYQTQKAAEAKAGVQNGLAHLDSVHEMQVPDLPETWIDSGLEARWSQVHAVRRVALAALEAKRKEGLLGSSLQGRLILYLEAGLAHEVGDLDWAELSIVSDALVHPEPAPEHAFRLENQQGVAVEVELAAGDKCQRCWRVLPEVAAPGFLCDRCAEVQVLEGWRSDLKGVTA